MACIIVGRPNSGKTSFLINFAAYLGLNSLKISVRRPQGYLANQTMTIARARSNLITCHSHTTRNLQSIKIVLPKGKRGKEIEIIDTCGLAEGIHPDREVRMGMAQTIEKILLCKMALHILDLSAIEKTTSTVDNELYQYLKNSVGYALLANKIDKEDALAKITHVRNTFSSVPVFPISALYSRGFKEVYRFVLAYY